MKNTINGVQETISKRIAEVAHPSDLKAAGPIQQKYFLLMLDIKSVEERTVLAKKMQEEISEQSSINVNRKLD